MSEGPRAEARSDAGRRAVDAVQQALRLVCLSLPHLAGLAYLVRVSADARAGTIAVFPSGRIVVNPTWFARLDRREATFVVAHELLHLALQTHQRAGSGERKLFNLAHDYIINDMLSEALGCPPPASGLALPGARTRSAESLVDELRRRRAEGEEVPSTTWGRPEPAPPDTALGAALRKAAGLPPLEAPPPDDIDVLPSGLEGDWFPDLDRAAQQQSEQRVREAAARSVSLELLREHVERGRPAAPGGGSGDEALLVEALSVFYRPPWEVALQQWMEAVAPGPRSFARPSRRGADRTDLVLAGRRREGWTLHIVLDTSGSMTTEIARALGSIRAFCEGVGVGQVHLLQCDVEVTRDELVAVEQLGAYEVAGFGGSDLSPALLRLAEDPEVEAAIVITDGYIEYPPEAMPYALLWVLTEENPGFGPPYGRVLALTG